MHCFSAGWRSIVALSLVLCCSVAIAAAAETQKEEVAEEKEISVAKSTDNPVKDVVKSAKTAESDSEFAGPKIELAPDIPGLVRLSKDSDIWLDPKRKIIVAEGVICLRRGMLEMFACPRHTKEHESIISVNGPASVVHAGLLAVGAKSGTPATFRPTYKPPTGTKIAIYILWKDKDGNRHQVRAQEWIRNARTNKAMEYDWVFAGSRFTTDGRDGETRYSGDGGDFVCVSNFPSATLDIPVKSSQSDEELLFEAFTERIPKLGTKVRLVFVPERN